MISNPPHLPAPTCNLEHHRKWERLKLLLTAVFFGLLAGGTGASMILGWVWPGLGGGDSWILSHVSSNPAHDFLDDQVRVELEDRVGTLYRDFSGVSGVNYFSQDKKISDVFFVSSDGWLVFYDDKIESNIKTWQVLLKNGNVYNVQKVLHDANANLTYIKINSADGGAQFKVVSFADDAKPTSDVFVFDQGVWKRATVFNKIARAFHLPHLDNAPSQAFELSASFSAGDIVANGQGKIVGVISNNNFVMPAQYLTSVLPGVLSLQKVTYRTLGVYGWFSDEQPLLDKNGKIDGFVVTRVVGDTKLKVGDVISTVNGNIVNGDILWYNIMSNQSVKLQVLRKDKTVEIVQDIKQI